MSGLAENSMNSSRIAGARSALVERYGLDEAFLRKVSENALGKWGDFADIYLQSRASESWRIENGKIKAGTFGIDLGYGMRTMRDAEVSFASSQRIDRAAMETMARRLTEGYGDATPVALVGLVQRISSERADLYGIADPLLSWNADRKIALLRSIDELARSLDPRVVSVNASVQASHETVWVTRHDGFSSGDIRPLVKLAVAVTVLADGHREMSGSGFGGRAGYEVLTPDAVETLVRKVVSSALTKLEGRPAPAGPMTVVIGAGWNGVLLHEAVGHGLEGDFNQRGSSAFSGRIGERIAAPGVTILDDGTVPGGRGSLNMDDEGVGSHRTVLVEDGILRGYMHDLLSARQMGCAPTGNGRRQSYASLPLPRMTNTYMEAGTMDPAEIIASVGHGIYVDNLSGGQVDVTSGRFVFEASEAFLIENGKLTAPVAGATILGNGPDTLRQISMIGSDRMLDGGVGVCSKSGQILPVGVGQPTLRVDDLIVGGKGS